MGAFWVSGGSIVDQPNAKGSEGVEDRRARVGKDVKGGLKRKGESLGKSSEEEGERRRVERGCRKEERRRRGE